MLSELIFIETRSPQLLAHLLARLPLACLAITPAVALTLLSEPILVFASEPQLFALTSGTPTSTIIHADATRSDLNVLSWARGGNNERRRGKDVCKLPHGEDPPSWVRISNGGYSAGFPGFRVPLWGAEAAVFVFNKDDSYDTVWDFNASEGDKIRLDPALGVVTLADLQNPSLAPHSTARITPSSRWRRRQ